MKPELLKALVWLCLILGFSMLVSQLTFMRLSWGLSEARLTNVQMRFELETMRNELTDFRIIAEEHRVIRCQVLLMMTASRSGWFNASRLLKSDLLDVCVQQETGQWKLPEE